MFAVSETTFKVLYDPPFIWRIFLFLKEILMLPAHSYLKSP